MAWIRVVSADTFPKVRVAASGVTRNSTLRVEVYSMGKGHCATFAVRTGRDFKKCLIRYGIEIFSVTGVLSTLWHPVVRIHGVSSREPSC
ncbi:hypothetical protein BD410DRAFT_302648 [Rickenella mellea]|uniref:Uncharacterized protein n=1 Tax=Rickenella mellea TaxID=50990 RepID=A0A4Y7Q2B9_9AGAM|nr:hypothetical protein BD410DRAFT_302648 [Rickenella mellea]